MKAARLLACSLLMAFLFPACETTRYGSIAAPQLTDQELVEELYAVYSKLGIVEQRIGLLLAIRPSPSYVIRGYTTSSASGWAYTRGNTTYGYASGTAQSTYWMEDQAAVAQWHTP